ncbi:MAG: hypothetical protein MHMPM18_003633 [Marteilia pararefringens]
MTDYPGNKSRKQHQKEQFVRRNRKVFIDGCKKIVEIAWRALQLFIILTMIIASGILTTKEYLEHRLNFAVLSKCTKKSFYDPESKKCTRDHLFNYILIYMYYNVVDISQLAPSSKNYIIPV